MRYSGRALTIKSSQETYKTKKQKTNHSEEHVTATLKTNIIYHRSSMQTEIPQPEGKRIMPETRFTEFLAISVDPRVGISWSASEIDYKCICLTY